MAQEDLTTWTEKDPNNDVAVSANLLDAVLAPANAVVPIVFKDKGVGGYDGSFEIKFKINKTAGVQFLVPVCVSEKSFNDGLTDRPYNGFQGQAASDDSLFLYIAGASLIIANLTAGTFSNGSGVTMTEEVDYWLTYSYDGTSATLVSYLDSARTILNGTSSKAHAPVTKRFVALCADYGGVGSGAWSTQTSEVDIGDAPVIANAIPIGMFGRGR